MVEVVDLMLVVEVAMVVGDGCDCYCKDGGGRRGNLW